MGSVATTCRIIAAFCAVAALGACAGNHFEGRPGVQAVREGALPAPRSADAKARRPFVIGPLDKISIAVFNVAELSKTVQVDGEGQVVLPLIGTLAAAGKSPGELSSEIAVRLRAKYVRDPDVAVTLETSNQTITVDGAVSRPGMYPVLNEMTLMRAIASGGGASGDADTNYVVVFREVGGVKYAGLYDLRAIRQGAYDDPPVYANDVIVIGDSPGRRIFQYAIQGSSLLIGPLIAILSR